jgi:hypothetical protein
MKQAFFCTRAFRAISATMTASPHAIALRRSRADSESRILATKLFSWLTPQSRATARSTPPFCANRSTAIREARALARAGE